MKPNKLLQLLRDNAANGAAARTLRAEAGDDASVNIYIYEVIDPYWGASAAGLIAALATAAGQPVCLHINSPGGDVFEARAMAAAVADYAGPVEACIDGLCASAATYLALAAGSVSMVQGALLMVHNSWTLAYGDKTDLRSTADLLDKIDGTIVADYVRKTGATPAQVQAWMAAETWFTAEEALAAKFIDEIEPNTQAADAQEDAQEGETGQPPDPLMARWNLSAYAKAPVKRSPRPAAGRQTPAQITAQAAAQAQANRNRLALLNHI